MNGEVDDFDAVFRSVYPRARGVALKVLGSVTDAEDAASEALARALVAWPKVGVLPFREAWILRVTANVAIDMVRHRSRTYQVPSNEGADDEVVELRLTLVAALSALPRRQRETVVLRHLGGLSEHDVAVALGVSQNTVKKHLQRAMVRLRLKLGTEEGMSIAFD